MCIGIDKFLNMDIPRLSYCESDCFRMKRALSVYNIAKKSEIILNEYATKNYILKSLKELSAVIDHLYIYISTHGDMIKNKFYTYTYESVANNIPHTALQLDILLEIINNSHVQNAVVIIDSCKIKFPRVFNKKITIYCPKKDITFEDTFYKQSLFTKAIIKCLSKKYLNNFGTDATIRYQKIRQRLFLQSQKQNTIYIYGDSGLGKSHFLRQIAQCEQNTCYISIPNKKDITYDIVLTLISENLILYSKDQFYNAIDADPERYIRFYSNINPHHLIIIDHFEYLEEKIANAVIKFLNDIPAMKLFASKTYKFYIPNQQLFLFPPLKHSDIDEFIKDVVNPNVKVSDYKERYLCSNFIKLLEYIYNHEQNKITSNIKEISQETKKISKAVAVSGGFINEVRFAKSFELDHEILLQVVEKGLIIKHESFYHPHDIIYNETISQKELLNFQKRAKNYWKQEILSNHSPKSVHNYILLLKNFSFRLNKNEINFYKKIISLLKGRQNTYYLLILYDYFIQSDTFGFLSSVIGESLIEIGRFDEVSKLISLSKNKSMELLTLSVELLWWQGKFKQCVKMASLYLNDSSMQQNYSLICSKGIGNFFLGKWEESFKDLNQVTLFSSTENKQKCLAYCVLGTIQGLRGTDLASSVSYFIESIKIAKKSGKLLWLAIIYGNIGEIFWKANFLQQSIEILNMAHHLSYLTDNDPLLLEINRNLLHALHRNKQFDCASTQLTRLADTLNNEADNYVKMQLINTLITHYIFYNNCQYSSYVSDAIKLTKDNYEYYIYTLSNLSIIQLITDQNIDLAIETMIHALELSASGQNWLAIKQCLDDWDEVIKIYNLKLPSSQQVFQKWHQVLQKELLPNLHHLSSLYAFLQQP